MTEKKAFPAIGWGFLIVLILLGVQLLGGIIAGIAFAIMGMQNDLVLLTTIVNSAAFLVVLAISVYKIKEPVANIFSHKSIQPLVVLALLIVAVGLTILLSEIDNAFRYFFPMPGFIVNIFKTLYASENIVATFVLLVIFAPITEEYIFRGIILRGFLKNYNPMKAIILSSVIFSNIQYCPCKSLAAYLCFYRRSFYRVGLL